MQHQLGQLKGQKAALAAELDNYMAACKAEEEAQASLTRQIQVSAGKGEYAPRLLRCMCCLGCLASLTASLC